MAEDDSSQEKTEEPTPRRIEKSREEGQVPRSRELGTTILLMAGGLCMIYFGPILAGGVGRAAQYNFSFDRQAASDPALMGMHLRSSFAEVAPWFFIIVLLLFVAAVVGTIGVGGWNFTTKAIQPKLSKLNPLSGIKRMFSMNSLVELGKGWAKVLLVGGVAIFTIQLQIPSLLAMTNSNLAGSVERAIDILGWSFLLISASTILIALIDVPFQIYSSNKKLRMTLQEIKEEFKNSEGKPEVKAKIRQLQREMSQRRMMSDVPDADVVITNPEHFSVALKYKHQEMAAPIIVALGADEVAFKIREIAKEYRIPVVEMPPLARALYHFGDVGEEIPEQLFMAVAQILAYVYQLDQWRAGQADRPPRPDVDIPADFRWEPKD